MRIFMDFIIDVMDDIFKYFIGKHINLVNSIFYYNEPSLHSAVSCFASPHLDLHPNFERKTTDEMIARTRVAVLRVLRSEHSSSASC